MGVFPKPFINRADASIKQINERAMKQAGGVVEVETDCGCETEEQ